MNDGYFEKKLEQKKCKQCGDKFEPYTTLSMCCSIKCSLEYNRLKETLKHDKAWLVKKASMKEKLMSYSQWMNKAQKIFNEYIRMRDKDQLCICCDKPLGQVFHAGHYFSTGAYPGLRLDEDNCHGQREDCNLHKHGNQAEYSLLLPIRIGEKKFNALLNRRKDPPKKLSIPEIKELIEFYKTKIKGMHDN